jgi:hypothetical protein
MVDQPGGYPTDVPPRGRGPTGRRGPGGGVRGVRGLRPTVLIGWLAVVGLLGGGVAAVSLADGPSARAVSLDDGAAWLVSSGVGQAALLDGSSAQVVAQLPVGKGDLSVAQSGVNVFVANSTTGNVLRIDGATLAKSAPARFAEPGQPLTVFPGRTAVYTVSETAGTVTVADPATLRTRGTQSLGAKVRPGASLVDGDGRLWLVDGDTGDLVRVDGAGKRVTPKVADPAASTLVMAGGRVALVDTAARTVRAIGADGAPAATSCLDTRQGDDTVTVTGSPSAGRVYAASGSRGVLLVSDLDRGKCDQYVDLGAAGHRLGAAEEVGGRVFVPDYTTGQVAVVDLSGRRVVARPEVLPANTPFELVPSGGFVFYNDPASASAGVVRLDGSSVPVRKYDPGQPGAGLLGSGSGSGSSATPTGPVRPPASSPASPPPSSRTSPPPAGAGSVGIEVSAARTAVGEPLTMRVVATGGARLSLVRWRFGDDAEGAGTQVKHAWTTPGAYTISAQVTLGDGRRAAPTVKITVDGQVIPTPTETRTPKPTPPDPGGGPGPGPGPGPGGGGGGGGETTTPPPPAGPTARLKLSSKAGTAQVSSIVVTADASGSTAGGAPISTYAFDFTGAFGAAQTGSTASHTYGNPEPITVTVRVTDSAGRTSEATASMPRQFYRLEVTVAGGGSSVGTVTGPEELLCPDVCGASLRGGQQVTLVASTGPQDSGVTFDGWSGGACAGSTNKTCTFTIDADTQVSAGFTKAATRLPAPVLDTPADGATFNTGQPRAVSFRCIANQGNRYEFEVEYEDPTNGIWSSWRDVTLPYCAYDMDDFAGAQRGRWRVTTWDNEDPAATRSDPSAWRIFTEQS